MNYTPNQQEAIDARGENLLISAAAGSGKTRVLVDRIVKMVQSDRVPLEQMLIVTFTNAAAGEMRTRLRQGLEEAAHGEEGEAKAFLLEQLASIPEAHISTMHAFCIAELRRFYHVLGLDPSFKILAETTTTIMREEALEEVMDAAYESDDEAFLNLVAAYGGKSGDEKVRNLVRSVYGRIQAHEEPLAWLFAQIEAFNGGAASGTTALFVQEVGDVCEEMAALMAKERALADQMPNADKLHEMLNEDESILAGLKKASQKKDALTSVMSYMEGTKWMRKPAKPRNATGEVADLDARITALRGLYKEALKPLEKLGVEGGAERIMADRQLVHPMLVALGELVAAFDQSFTALKREKQGLDFNDLEHLMLALLKDEATKAAVMDEIRYIFFDEYQDANPIQEAIVEALKTPNQLFFVGDVKQAIYRFRRADPNIFNRRYARYQKHEDGRLIFLSENFRSRREVLDFSNALFATLMTKSLGDVDYMEPGQALVCGSTVEEDKEAVQIVTVVDEDKVEKEAVWIAAEIERLVAEGRYGYGDFVVLMRSPKARLRTFEEVFKAKHIPYYSDNSVTSFHNLEVRLFRSMLTVIANDENDNDLLAALISPFGGLRDEELAAIRIYTPEGAFFEAARRYMEERDDDTALKLEDFYARIKKARHALHYESVCEVAIRLFEESGYSAFLLGLDGGSERVDNVYAFIDMIQGYEASQRYGLVGFLHYVDTLEARSMDNAMPGIGLSENDSCVRIMSVHKSKGLGFKVVFLADLSRRFNLRDTMVPVVMDDTLGLGVDVVDVARGTTHHSFEKKLIALKTKKDTLSEEVRLLYVALTRAIDRLYLVTSIDEKIAERLESGSETARADEKLAKGFSYRDWLLACMEDADHPLSIKAERPLYKWQLVNIDAEEDAIEEEARSYSAILDHWDEDEVARIGARFNHAYPYEDLTTRPFKKTVSELAKKNIVMPEHVQSWPQADESPAATPADIRVPRFIDEHVSFTGARMGTLMHQVVQWLPMQPQSADAIEAALASLVARAFLTKEEAAAVDREMLVQFYASDFVARISKVAFNIEHEVSFTMKTAEYMVDGQIDMFFETAEGYEIVDFKTDRVMRTDSYRAQLDMYAQALEKARGKRVTKKWLYWLRFTTAEEV